MRGVALAGLLFLVPTAGRAQVLLTAGAGVNLPVSDGLTEDYEPGIGFAVGVGGTVSRSVIMEAAVHIDNMAFEPGGGLSGADLQFRNGVLGVLVGLPLRGRVFPYVRGAVLVSNKRMSELRTPDGVLEGAEETDLGTAAGAGVDVPLARRYTLFAEGQLVFIYDDEPVRYAPVRGGVRVSLGR